MRNEMVRAVFFILSILKCRALYSVFSHSHRTSFLSAVFPNSQPSAAAAVVPVAVGLLDKSYIFDDSISQNDRDAEIDTPSFLLAPILCGMEHLPSEHALRERQLTMIKDGENDQDGQKGHVHYKGYRKIVPNFEPIKMSLENGLIFESLSSAQVIRTVDIHASIHAGGSEEDISSTTTTTPDTSTSADTSYGTFRLYKFKIKKEIADQMNEELLHVSKTYIVEDNAGVSVSNAGGYHSPTTCFEENKVVLLKAEI